MIILTLPKFIVTRSKTYKNVSLVGAVEYANCILWEMCSIQLICLILGLKLQQHTKS